MKTKCSLFSLIIGYAVLWNPVHAQANRADKPFQIQGIISEIGFGGSIGYHVSRQLMIGGDFSTLSLSLAKTTHYDTVSHHLTTAGIKIRYFPDLGSGLPKLYQAVLSALYCQAGAAYRSWKFETMKNDIEADGVKADVKFSPFAATAGLGFNWILKWGLSFGLGMDFFFGPKPTIDITSGPGATADEISGTRSDVDKHHNMGAVTVNPLLFIGYNF